MLRDCSKVGRSNVYSTGIVILFLLFTGLSANGQTTSSEIRVPDYMQDEMRYLESQERSLQDTVNGLGTLYTDGERAIELEKIYKQKKVLEQKIKKYQEDQFEKLKRHNEYQRKFKSFSKVLVSELKLNTVYKNVKLSFDGEVFPEFTIIVKEGEIRTIKVKTSMWGDAFLRSSVSYVYIAK